VSGDHASSVASNGGPNLAPIRDQIDALDREIVRLLNERARLGIRVGQAKAGAGLPIHDPEREDDVLRRVREANDGPIPDDELLALYGRIIALTRQLEGPSPAEPPTG